MTCLDDRRLLDVHFGDGATADRQHVAGCAGCAARMQSLARALTRIDGVLRTTTPPRRALRPAPAWRWAPLAAAAVLALAVAVHRFGGAPVVATDDDDTLALVDELARVMVSDVTFGATASGTTSQTRSTCTWGDPLLGVGCDEPVAVQIAWH